MIVCYNTAKLSGWSRKCMLVHDREAREQMLYIKVEFQKSQQLQQQKITRKASSLYLRDTRLPPHPIQSD